MGATSSPPTIIDDLNREITAKFASGQPILLPPKDYTPLDRVRGNLDEARHRRATNPLIVGAGGSVAIIDEDKPSPAANMCSSSSSSATSSSIDEQTNEVLRMLDDVVNSESFGERNSGVNLEAENSSSSLAPRLKHETLVFEFKPPASTTSAATPSSSLSFSNVTNQKLETTKSDTAFYMSAREFIDEAKNNDDDGDVVVDVKPNPLHVLDDDFGFAARQRPLSVACCPPGAYNRVECLLAGDRFRKSWFF